MNKHKCFIMAVVRYLYNSSTIPFLCIICPFDCLYLIANPPALAFFYTFADRYAYEMSADKDMSILLTLRWSQIQPFKLLLSKSYALFVALLLIFHTAQSCWSSSSLCRSRGRSRWQIAVAFSVIARWIWFPMLVVVKRKSIARMRRLGHQFLYLRFG